VIFLVIFIALFLGLILSNCFYLFIPISILFIFYCFKKFNKQIGILVSILIPIGCGISYIHFDQVKTTYEGIVIESKDNYFILQSGLNRYYIYEKNNQYEIGDILNLYGNKKEIDFEVLESSFDFNSYLNSKGVYSQISVSKKEEKFLIFLRPRKLRKEFLSTFSDSNTRQMVGSILFNDAGEGDLKNENNSLHLNKIFSSSGLYLSFFITVVEKLLEKKINKNKSKIITYLILLPYFIFVFPKISVIKMLLSFFIWLVNHLVLKDKLDHICIVSLSSLLLLLFDYHYAFQIGFLLSSFLPLISILIRNSFLRVRPKKRKLLVYGTILLFMLPIEIYFYNSVAPLSQVFQILFLPFFYLYSFISLLTFYKVPLSFVLKPLTEFYKWSLDIFKSISFEIYCPSFHPLMYFVYYVLLFLMLYLLSIKYKPLSKVPIIAFCSLLAINFIPISNFYSSKVSFINVGQGDSILIRNKLHSALIDTGGLTYKDVAMESLIPYLKKNRIYELDYVFITHNDNDHMGALESLNEHFKIKNIITESSYFPISMGDITFKNLNTYVDISSEENDKSLVISFEIKGSKFLCMGDASTNIEKKIIKDNPSLRCDYLKIGHHGSDTSSNYNFLKTVNPKEAIISVGKNNSYGHPSSTILSRLNSLKISYRRTDLESTISYYF